MRLTLQLTRRTPPERSAFALVLATLVWATAAHGDDTRAKTPAPSDKTVDGEIARYCGNLAPTASEARAAYQAHQLADLEQRVRQATQELERNAAEAREWVTKRETMMKSATDEIVAVYAKMSADAAATQLSAMDDAVAAAVLFKLNPRAASAILAEMDAGKAARLASLMAAAYGADKS